MKKLALLLFVFCAALLVPVGWAWAEWSKTQGALSLGTSGIGVPTYNAGNTSWQGSFVYYGKYKGTPMVYRVLSPRTEAYGGTTVLLDCHTILEKKAFDSTSPYSNVWKNGELYNWLNGNDFLLSTDVFTYVEQTAIAKSTRELSGKTLVYAHTSNEDQKYYLGNISLTGEKVFLLDVTEATNPAYGYPFVTYDENVTSARPEDATRVKDGCNGYYWLRSPNSVIGNNAGCVDYVGYVNDDYVSVPLRWS